MASPDEFYNTEFDSGMEHTREHLIKLTKNLLDFQQTGMCCDITLQCKDGTVKAHSGIKVYPVTLHAIICTFDSVFGKRVLTY